VALGEAAVARALARELGQAGPGAEARRAAGEPGAAPPAGAPDLAALCAAPRAAEALPRALAPLLRELRATLRAWRAREGQRPVARAWLAGSLARLPGLAELVAAEVGGPARPLEMAGPAAEGVPADAAPGLALALSAALRGHLGGRASRLNLRRGDAAYTRDMEQLKQRVGRLAVYAALVLLLAGASWGVRLFALSRQELLVDRALCEAEEKVLGRCLGSVEEAVSALRGRGIPGAGIPKASAVDVLGELAQRTPEGVKVRFDRIDITDKKLHLQGTTEAPENVDKVVEALKGSRCFADARSGGARKRGTEAKFEFSIDSALGCVGGKE
jgi:general secretion pathway protein L